VALFDQTIPVAYGTELTPRAAKKVILMDDNSYSINSLSSQEVYTGKIILPFLTSAQSSTVMSFYETNKDLTWQFNNPQDEETYDLEYLDPAPTPRILEEYDPPRYEIIFTVIGTKQ